MTKNWTMGLLIFFAVGQLLHWYQLHLLSKKAGAQIQLPKLREMA